MLSSSSTLVLPPGSRPTTRHLFQTRFYRAPEVIIESKWDEKADLWSVGCIMLEMYFGRLVFDTHDSLEHLHLIEKFCGRIPQSLLQRSPDTCEHVERGPERCTMTPDEALRKIPDLPKKRAYLLSFQSLKSASTHMFPMCRVSLLVLLQILSKRPGR